MKRRKIKGKILYIIVLILVALFSSVGTVFAARIIASSGVSYSNGSSGLLSTNVQGALDELYGKYVKLCLESGGCNVPLAMYLRTLEASSTVEVDDGTGDHNMRYIGPNPSNYVLFNGELWRIIGVFNSNSHGMDKDLVKIQYTKSLNIPFDDTNVSNWARPGTLNTYLNEGEYYTSKLNATAKNMIQEVTWKIGGAPYDSSTFYPNVFYNYERGKKVYSGSPTTWNGKIALAYLSDYLYSTTGGSTYNREACFANPARNVDNTYNPYWRTDGANAGDCATGSWMIQQARTLSFHAWTLTSRSDHISRLFAVTFNYSGGTFHDPSAAEPYYSTVPVVYLKSDVTCINCSDSTAGTETNPYQLSIE